MQNIQGKYDIKAVSNLVGIITIHYAPVSVDTVLLSRSGCNDIALDGSNT
jgi:hypothetical protein